MTFHSVKKDVFFQIEYADICDVSKFPFDNSDADLSGDSFIQQNYSRKWMLQIQLSTINGITTQYGVKSANLNQDLSIDKRST